MRKHFSLKTVFVLVVSAILVTSLVSLYLSSFVQSYTQPSYYTFENAPCAADTYLIYKSGRVYYSRNTDSGVVSSDANCTTLVHALRDAMGNGTIFFKPGVYTLNLVIDKNDVTIKGDGHNSTYFRNDNANPVIDVQGLSGDSLKGITIEDVTVHGTGASGIGIRATHCYHTLTLEGVRVQSMDSYGVYLENCYDALLQDCIIQSNTDWGVYADQCHAMGITDCYIIDNGDSTAGNIHLNHTAGSSIHGTTIENSKYGVKISDNAHGVTISNSFLEVSNEGSNLVWITGNSTAYPKNTVIENSFFEGKSGTWPDAYIYIDYATETKVEGNYLPVYPGMIGINITAQASYTKIEGNQFRSTGTFLTDLGTDTTIIQPQNQGLWWSGDNRTDLIVNPTDTASYIVETDGTQTWMTNCSTGQRDATGTDADEISNWALGNLTSGGVVYLKPDVSVDGEVTLSNGNITIKSDLIGYNQYSLPHIRELTINSSSQAIEGIKLQGLTIEELTFHADGNEITNVRVSDCAIRKTSTYHGVIFQGDGTTSGWMNEILFDRCHFKAGGQDGDTWGVVTWNNVQMVTEVRFRDCAFETYQSNNTFFLCTGTGQPDSVFLDNPRIYTDTGTENIYVFRQQNRTVAEYKTGFAVSWSGGRIEAHTPITILRTDDSTVYGVRLRFTVQGVVFGMGAGSTLTAIDNQNSKWATPFNYITWKDNVCGRNVGTFSLGTLPTASSTFEISIKRNVNFITENSGTQTCANNEAIIHGLAGTPTMVQAIAGNCTYDGEYVVATYNHGTMDATDFHVCLFWVNGTAITDDVILISWYAEYAP